MAYIPDEWVMGDLELALSTVRLLFYYCGRADQDSGKTNVSAQRASQDLGIRKDHIDEHDRKLVREDLIRIETDENGGRIVCLSSPWQPRAERNGYPAQKPTKKAPSQVLGKSPQGLGEAKQSPPQDMGSPLDDSPSFGQIPQDLGSETPESPQDLGESPQDLGKNSPKLGGAIRNNQLMEPAHEPAQIYSGADAPVSGEGKPDSQPEERKPSRRKSAGKKPETPKSKFHGHPSVVEYRRVYKTVSADQATLIAQATGESVESAPAEWQAFVTELAVTGNKSTHNVRVIVLAYEYYLAGVKLAQAINLAWRREKGEPVSSENLAPYNRGKPTVTDRNQAVFAEFVRGGPDVIDIEGRRA